MRGRKSWFVRTQLHVSTRRLRRGFTLIEVMLGASILLLAAVALMGAFFGQAFLNGSARNMTAAMNDASRVMEQIRQQNTGGLGTCAAPQRIPSMLPPAPFKSWNEWLNARATDNPSGGGPKSIVQRGANTFELMAVTCQDGSSTAKAAPYCASNQAGTGEWFGRLMPPQPTTFDPIRVTVAVSWREGGRSIGGTGAGAEFTYTPAHTDPGTLVQVPEQLTVGADQDGDGAIGAPAMITTFISCR